MLPQLSSWSWIGLLIHREYEDRNLLIFQEASASSIVVIGSQHCPSSQWPRLLVAAHCETTHVEYKPKFLIWLLRQSSASLHL